MILGQKVASGLQGNLVTSRRRVSRGLDPEGGEGRTMNRTLSGDVQYNDGDLGISQCVWCRHRSDGGRCCRAFPKGIPEAITNNRHDHRDAYDGDNGVRFEPEVVEIEFVDTESTSESASLSAGLAAAMARVGEAKYRAETAEIVGLDQPKHELDEDGFDLGSVESG
jgi:hypothetical protein